MRLQRGVAVAGLDPQHARLLAKACAVDWADAETVAARVGHPVDSVRSGLDALTAHEFLITEPAAWDPCQPWWRTTIAGSALAMASFLKPISRAKVERLLAGVLERASAYDADDEKPYMIGEIAVFGSYLNPEAVDFGDLDLAVKFAPRAGHRADSTELLAYARASGRSFSTLIQELAFAEHELLRILRNRSGYINVHTEDITRFTEAFRVVYPAS